MITRKIILLYALAAVVLYEYATTSPQNSSVSDAIANIGGMMNSSGMTTSAAGLAAITQREGYEYAVYADTEGYLTGGIGHKLTPADKLQYSVGDALTDAKIQSWFSSDISRAENLVNFYVSAPLSQNQFDALVSMTFNLGGQLWRNSNGTDTGINTALQNGDYQTAAQQIMRWDIPASIIGRRQSEQGQFLA